jgi:glucose-6-phosphate isomerase
MSINFDFSKTTIQSNDNAFFSPDQLKKLHQQWQTTIQSDAIGFYRIVDNNDAAIASRKVYESKKGFKHFVHIGIGGSSLGPEMLISALAKNNGTEFTFINNIDPDRIHDQLEKIDLKNALFYFVSKSGGTAETMAALAIVADKLHALGIVETSYKDRMVFCTDPVKSELLTLGAELGIDCLTVPSNVGGRFSVLTAVGLFPALYAGINPESLLEGARQIKTVIEKSDTAANPLLQFSAHVMALKEKNVTQTVFMPYSSKLRDFSFWFIQLWAESLGKKNDRNGKQVHQGLTPVPGYGATDQHSQMQLFMEGPYDKLLVLLEVDQFAHDYSLNSTLSAPALKKLAPYSLSQLMRAEFNGTLMALSEEKRPYIRLTIPKTDEVSLGGLVIFFESLTALMGHWLNIDPFDQPGVEAGKRYAYEWLNSARI